jgi:putative transposase
LDTRRLVVILLLSLIFIQKKSLVVHRFTHESSIGFDALNMAIWQRRPSAGLIVYTDRGSQYASKAYRNLLLVNDIQGSMSRKGDCWDNDVFESFFGSLKQERVQW